jgi:hypothetical protein
VATSAISRASSKPSAGAHWPPSVSDGLANIGVGVGGLSVARALDGVPASNAQGAPVAWGFDHAQAELVGRAYPHFEGSARGTDGG